MKKLVLMMALSIFVLFGCATGEKENQVQVIDVADSGLFRESGAMDENSFYTRPYNKAGVIFTLNVKPKDDALITIVPIGVDLSSFNERIQRVEEIDVEADDKKYNIFIGDIVKKDILESMPLADRRDDAPFDVACIYPAVETAAVLDLKTVDMNTLPEKDIKSIKCLIDIDNDAVPDIAIVQIEDDYIVSRYYLKKNGTWKLLKEILPL
jgi:hypothetical protein